jgi:hypothetical protein
MMNKVVWTDFLARSKTLAFLSSHSERRTNIIKELVALWSAMVKRAVAAGHHSSRAASSDEQMSDNSSLVVTPTQTACANGQHKEDVVEVSRLVPQRGHMM